MHRTERIHLNSKASLEIINITYFICLQGGLNIVIDSTRVLRSSLKKKSQWRNTLAFIPRETPLKLKIAIIVKFPYWKTIK